MILGRKWNTCKEYFAGNDITLSDQTCFTAAEGLSSKVRQVKKGGNEAIDTMNNLYFKDRGLAAGQGKKLVSGALHVDVNYIDFACRIHIDNGVRYVFQGLNPTANNAASGGGFDVAGVTPQDITTSATKLSTISAR